MSSVVWADLLQYGNVAQIITIAHVDKLPLPCLEGVCVNRLRLCRWGIDRKWQAAVEQWVGTRAPGIRAANKVLLFRNGLACKAHLSWSLQICEVAEDSRIHLRLQRVEGREDSRKLLHLRFCGVARGMKKYQVVVVVGSPLGERHLMVEFHLVRIFEGIAACCTPSLLPLHEEGLALWRDVHPLGHLELLNCAVGNRCHGVAFVHQLEARNVNKGVAHLLQKVCFGCPVRQALQRVGDHTNPDARLRVPLLFLLVDRDECTAELMFPPVVKARPKRDFVILEVLVDDTHIG